jgi:hypothetical protein
MDQGGMRPSIANIRTLIHECNEAFGDIAITFEELAAIHFTIALPESFAISRSRLHAAKATTITEISREVFQEENVHKAANMYSETKTKDFSGNVFQRKRRWTTGASV